FGEHARRLRGRRGEQLDRNAVAGEAQRDLLPRDVPRHPHVRRDVDAGRVGARSPEAALALDHGAPQGDLADHAGDAAARGLGEIRAQPLEPAGVDPAHAALIRRLVPALPEEPGETLTAATALGRERHPGAPERRLDDTPERVGALGANHLPDAPGDERLAVVRRLAHFAGTFFGSAGALAGCSSGTSRRSGTGSFSGSTPGTRRGFPVSLSHPLPPCPRTTQFPPEPRPTPRNTTTP